MKFRLPLAFCFLLFAGIASALDPRLSFTNEQGEIVLSWPASATDWVLEQSVNLRPGPWIRVLPDLYQSNAVSRSLRVSTLAGNRFYRLCRPGPPVPGLTGYWQLDEGTGQVSDEGNGFGTTMLFTNAAWSLGRVGPGALRFAGDGRSWLSNSNYRVLPATGQPLSVSLWFSPDALTNSRCGVMGNANAADGWYVALDSPGPGTNFLVFASTGGGASLNVTGRTLLLPGQWHQLTVTHDGTQGSIYLDGALLGHGIGSLVTHAGPIYFGGGIANCDGFSGRLDDVRTYTNALTAEEISLTGHWRFDENTGNLVADSSVNGRHASVTDAAAWATGKDGAGIELSAGRVIIPNDYLTVLPPSGGPFSISFWLLPHALPPGRNGLMSCGDGANNGWHMAVEVETFGESRLHLGSTNCGGTLDLWAPLSLTNGAWTKLDLTYNGGIATVYANGVKVLAQNGAIQEGRSPLVLGTAFNAADFNGIIDDLRIYCRERDAAEIGPVAPAMWETVFINTTTNIVLQGSGPAGKPLTYTILPTVTPTNGTITSMAASPIVSYQAGARKGPDAFVYTVSDGEFISPPTTVWLSIVEPHWLSPDGGSVQPLNGTSPEHAWVAGVTNALDAIWKTNNYFDCFFYASGEYQTTGYKFEERSSANPGCKHIGSGAFGSNTTTVKLVGVWGSSTEESIFGTPNLSTYCDGFEVHHMVLDCNAANLPKYTLGEPVWFRIPLTSTARVDTVTLHWDDRNVPGNARWRFGRAAEFSLCTQRFATNTYVTNCTALSSTSQVDVVTVGADADEIVLQCERRGAGVDFYGLTEIEIAGAAVSLPTATIPGSGDESRLDSQHSILSVVDGDTGTWWISGSETQAQIFLPLAHGTTISQLNLNWACRSNAATGRLGPAASYLIRARDESTGQFYDVPFVRHPRSALGFEANTFGMTQSTNAIVTDQLMIVLTAREPLVDHYALREVTLQNGYAQVAMRLPSALTRLSYGGLYPVFRAFDHDPNTQWACDNQGMAGAILLAGSNMKFTNLKIIGFGTKAARECFPLYIVAHRDPSDPARRGNVLVEDCILTEPATNNADGLSAVALTENPPDGIATSVVRRCTVAGVKPYFAYTQGIAASLVENCRVEDCGRAVYFEPDANFRIHFGPVLIRSNQFVNVDRGVYFLFHPRGAFDSLTCIGNEIILSGTGGGGISACDTCNGGPSGSITNLTALNNVVRYADWTLNPARHDSGLLYSDIQHGVFGNNLIVLGTGDELRVRQYPAGIVYPQPPPDDCDQQVVIPPINPYYVPSLDVLPAGYRRAWFNNRSLSGTLFQVRTADWNVEHPASQQQWQE